MDGDEGYYTETGQRDQTCFVQTNYLFVGDARDLDVETGLDVTDEGAVTDGVDTHMFTFDIPHDVPATTLNHTVLATAAVSYGGNDKDVLVMNNPQQTRLKPADLLPAADRTTPVCVSASTSATFRRAASQVNGIADWFDVHAGG